jgi:hypothetical protein
MVTESPIPAFGKVKSAFFVLFVLQAIKEIIRELIKSAN